MISDSEITSWENLPRTSSYASEFGKHFLSGIINTRSFTLIILAYWVLGIVYLDHYNQTSDLHLFIYLERLLPLVVIVLPLIFFLSELLRVARCGKHRWRFALKRLFASRNAANFMVGIFLMTMLCLFMGMFTTLKGSFGALQGFKYDIWQANLDKLLFLDNDPWRVLFEPFHSTLLQQIIEINYNYCWHILVFSIIASAAFSDIRSETKIRYLVSIILVWVIVGTIFAGLFISAGPAFYGLVTGDEARFGEQLKALALYSESSTVNFQAYLWSAYVSSSPNFGTGISAFPSVHVSLVSMNVFFAFEINRKIGFMALAYAIFVEISSVYLAWHYAIDGLLGALIVAVIYYSTRAVMMKNQSGNMAPSNPALSNI